MKLWAGRFQKETDTLVNDFNSSISFDARMYKEDIAGSIAHAAMLGRQGIIEEHEAEKIIDGLKAILAEAGLSMANVVKTVIFLADINDFAAVNAVYAKAFAEPFPARSCVQVAAIPKGAKLEIECIAVRE